MRLFARIVWLISYGLTVVCLILSVWYAGVWVWVDYVALIPQWFYLFPLLLLTVTVWPAWHMSRWRWLLLMGVITAFGLWFPLIDVVIGHRDVRDDAVLTVMSWNTARWDEARRDDFIALMKANPSDVYMLQEVHYAINQGLHGYMLEQFPDYQAGHYGEFFTLSKYPLNCRHQDETGGFLACEALLPDGKITLVNVHLKRPFHVTNFETFWDFDTRWHQYEALRTYLASRSEPVLMAGDFNSTSNYDFIKTFSRTFDRNDPAGQLVFPRTFPANWPYMRIDYQFVSGNYRFCGYDSVDAKELSDHVGIAGRVCAD